MRFSCVTCFLHVPPSHPPHLITLFSDEEYKPQSSSITQFSPPLQFVCVCNVNTKQQITRVFGAFMVAMFQVEVFWFMTPCSIGVGYHHQRRHNTEDIDMKQITRLGSRYIREDTRYRWKRYELTYHFTNTGL